MSGRSYVSCLVHRAVVPRDETVCVDDYERNPARRRHVCARCIRTLSLARNEDARARALASWRRTIAEGAKSDTNGAGRG